MRVYVCVRACVCVCVPLHTNLAHQESASHQESAEDLRNFELSYCRLKISNEQEIDMCDLSVFKFK